MMITSVEFDHFKGILKGKLDLDKFTLLVGKTTQVRVRF